jgi:CubicO group peptidase (beta-lactamase class C family)
MGRAQVVAERIVAEGIAPSAAAGAGALRGGGFSVEVGGSTETFFDLASVTKPMTAVAMLRAGLDLGTTLGRVLPELRDTASGDVSLELLLSHRAGMKPTLPLFVPLMVGLPVDAAGALRNVANARRPEAIGEPPEGGFEPVYSDLGYILAGAALARFTGAVDAGEAIERLVVQPLGLSLGTARSLAGRHVEFAPTEVVEWRGGTVSGRVHDEAAWALTGAGGSGHAGMFGTVRGVLGFARYILENVAALEILWRERPGGTLRAGFDGKSAEGSSAGSRFGPRSFGHLGFTGTSLWVDPDAGVAAVLLTNRVHPTRDHVGIRGARPWAHDALYEAACAL